MIPLGLYLTNRATKYRPVFEADQLIKPLVNLLVKQRKETNGNERYSQIWQEYQQHAKLTLILYFLLLSILFLDYGTRGLDWPVVQGIIKVTVILIGIVYVTSLFRALSLQSGLYKTIGVINRFQTNLILIAALPLYGLYYYYMKNQIQEDLKTL